MALGKRQSILKKQFSSFHGVFYHLMSSIQSEDSHPFIFYEQETTSLGMSHFTDVKTLCKPWKRPRMALAEDGQQEVKLES